MHNNEKPVFRSTRNRFYPSQKQKDQEAKIKAQQSDKLKQEGNKLYKQKKYMQAIACYDSCIALDGPKSSFILNKVRCLKQMQKMKQALNVLQQIFDQQENNLKAYLLKGQLLVQIAKNDINLDKMNSGIQSIKKALNLCRIQNKPQFDNDVSLHLFKALKVRWYKKQQLIQESLDQLRSILKAGNAKKQIIDMMQYKKKSFIIPNPLICPITMQLMQEPVITESGHTYQKYAIKAHLQNNGFRDPVTRKQISNKLIHNVVVKQMNPWAFDYIEGQQWRNISV